MWRFPHPKQEEEEKAIFLKGNESSSTDNPPGKEGEEMSGTGDIAKRRRLSDPKQGEEEKAIYPKGTRKEITRIEQKQEEQKTEGPSGGQDSDFEQMIERLFAGETIAPVLPLKKREVHRNPPGSDQNLVFSIAESGDSSENSSSPDDSVPLGVLLFEIQLKPSNRLVIPEAKASGHFPNPRIFTSGNSLKLRITDISNKDWEMSLVYYTAEKAFMFIRGWTEFADWHSLDSGDVIGFYRPMPRFGINHFLVKYDRTVESLPKIPEFRRENFLFQIELSSGDIGFRRLFMPSTEVELHCAAIKHVVGTNRKKDILRFTDANSKDWYMDVVYYNANSYMIIKEWAEFVEEHNLVAMDVIKFYKPVEPLHLKHFLIEIVRKPGSGGPSGNGSYKGKEKMADG